MPQVFALTGFVSQECKNKEKQVDEVQTVETKTVKSNYVSKVHMETKSNARVSLVKANMIFAFGKMPVVVVLLAFLSILLVGEGLFPRYHLNPQLCVRNRQHTNKLFSSSAKPPSESPF